jgi:hypothetical protein
MITPFHCSASRPARRGSSLCSGASRRRCDGDRGDNRHGGKANQPSKTEHLSTPSLALGFTSTCWFHTLAPKLPMLSTVRITRKVTRKFMKALSAFIAQACEKFEKLALLLRPSPPTAFIGAQRSRVHVISPQTGHPP